MNLCELSNSRLSARKPSTSRAASSSRDASLFCRFAFENVSYDVQNEHLIVPHCDLHTDKHLRSSAKPDPLQRRAPLRATRCARQLRAHCATRALLLTRRDSTCLERCITLYTHNNTLSGVCALHALLSFAHWESASARNVFFCALSRSG